MSLKQIIVSATLVLPALAAQAQPSLLPYPAFVTTSGKDVCVEDGIYFSDLSGDERLDKAIDRFAQQMHQFHDFELKRLSAPAKISVSFAVEKSGLEYPQYGDDESYDLRINATDGIQIHAETVYGALYALQTLAQLSFANDNALCFKAALINDKPRFKWRGIMIDVVRHWIGPEHIKRQIDLMASAKYNVLHLHLSDDQGFRLESKTFPKLHEESSDGDYFTQAQVQELIEYAADRGIRIVPEFGLPGHSKSWQIAYPFLAVDPDKEQDLYYGPTFSDPMDPTKEEVYDFIDQLMAEVTAIFPDQYFHIGGDEAKFSVWEDSDHVRSFMSEHKMETAADLQAYFTKRYSNILANYDRTVVGWNEILHPSLPKDAVIHMWNKTDFPPEIAAHPILVSSNYYFGFFLPAEAHYRNDPSAFEINGNPAPELANSLMGVEVAAWAEMMDPRNIDMRLWPRGLAVAERLWSPAVFTDDADIDDVYDRMDVAAERLVDLGAKFRSDQEALLREVTDEAGYPAIKTLADVVEATPYYQVEGISAYIRYFLPDLFSDTRYTPEELQPFTRALSPESLTAWKFERQVELFLENPEQNKAEALLSQLEVWRSNHAAASDAIARSEVLTELGINEISDGLYELAEIGERLVRSIASGTHLSDSDMKRIRKTVESYEHEDMALTREYIWHTFKVVLFRSVANRQHKIAIQPAIAKLVAYATRDN